jgi:hypothetical protein
MWPQLLLMALYQLGTVVPQECGVAVVVLI